MKTITFNTENAQAVESAVCKEFDCTVGDLVNVADTFQKKVVVYLLSTVYGYDSRTIGYKYQMTYLYVPTVVEETKRMMQLIPSFAMKINRIIIQLNYGTQNVEFARNRDFETALSGL